MAKSIIYSSTPLRGKGPKGATGANPMFFAGPESDVDHVYLNGNHRKFPEIKRAYENAGVKVSQFDPSTAKAGPDAAAKKGD